MSCAHLNSVQFLKH